MRFLAAVLSLLVLICICVLPARAEQRVALVIGNGAYRHIPELANPKNDAEDVARALRDLGFELVLATDVDHAGMNAALDRFSRTVAGADIALIYYSGRGMQFAGKNFLLPIDARLTGAEDVNRFQLTPLDDVFDALRAAKRSVVVLDACRNNPVEQDLKRRLASLPGGSRDAYLSRGLGRISASNGLIVVYATQADDVAADGLARNSPFTEAFVKHVATPNIDLRDMLYRVQDEVDRTTDHRQRPELSLSPFPAFKLKVAGPANAAMLAPDNHPTPSFAPSIPPFDPRAMELSHWESVRNSTSPAIIQTYLDRYPAGAFAALAKARLAELQQLQRPLPPQPPRPADAMASLPPAAALVPRTSQQASFNCGRPEEPIEHLICADADLAEWDGRMGKVYRSKLNDARNKEPFRQQQREWLERRDAQCRVPKTGNWRIAQLAPMKPCILQMTRERVSELASR